MTTDIFLSYHNSDRATAQIFADTLEARGWSVWWDREIPLGRSYDEVIEHELTTARCAIVLWSKEAVQSRWVRTEASVAATRERLVPVMIEEAPIPLEFRQIQTAMLIGWSGDTTHPEYLRLIDALNSMIHGTPQLPASVPPTPVPARATLRVPRLPRLSRKTKLPAAVAALAVIAVLAFVQKIIGGGNDNASDTENAGIVEDMLPGEVTQPGAALPVPEGAFRIAIGDAVSDGVPGAGAGVIETPHSRDLYVFDARRGQRAFFRVVKADGLSQISWTLTDETGTELFDTCFGCGDAGVVQFPSDGRYLLTVGSDHNTKTGPYELRIYDVPAPSEFEIKIGDVIGNDVPGKGAGTIESPGALDVFTFDAEPKQTVYFRLIKHSRGVEQLKWTLTEEDGMEVFDACLGCGQPAVQTLTKGGTYKITVGNEKNWATGTYDLQLIDVPPPGRFTIRLSERVSDGNPGKGAGVIEAPGAEDYYTFTATAGQRIAPQILDYARGMEQIRWRLIDSNDMELFDTCLGCGAPGPQRLTAGGQYTLVVGNPRDTHAATGAYSLVLTPVR